MRYPKLTWRTPGWVLCLILAFTLASGPIIENAYADRGSRQKLTRTQRQFKRTFKKYCAFVDDGVLDALNNFLLHLEQLGSLLDELLDMSIGINIDPFQCMPGFDPNIGFEFPDFSSCFAGLDMDFGGQCELEIPNLDDFTQCIEELSFDFDFDFDFDPDEFQQCMDLQGDALDPDELFNLFHLLAGDIEAMVRALEDFNAGWDPEFLINLHGLASFCGKKIF